MHKERFYIGIALLAAIMLAAYVAALLINERNRRVSVEELRNRAATLEEGYRQRRLAQTVVRDKETQKTSAIEEEDREYRDEDTIAAFEEFDKKKAAVAADPRWRNALELLNKGRQNELTRSAHLFAISPILEQVDKGRWHELTAAEKEQVVAFIDANQELIQELRHLAERGGPFHEMDLSKRFDFQLPHLEQLRDYARLLSASVAVAAARSDHATIVEDIIAIMRLSEAISREPIITSQLERGCMGNILYDCVVQNLRGEDIPPELLKHIADHAIRIRGRDAFADSLLFDALFWSEELFDGIRRGTSNHWAMNLYGSIGRPLLNRDEAIFLELMESTSDAMRLPYYQAQSAFEQIYDEIERLPYIRFFSQVTLDMLFSNYAYLPKAQAHHEATLGLMQVGLAVEHYHGQRGAYPQTIQEIAPILGGPIPLDPYTGQSFVYEPRHDGFTLYSARGNVVGPGDRPIPLFYNTQGNIVWRYTGE